MSRAVALLAVLATAAWAGVPTEAPPPPTDEPFVLADHDTIHVEVAHQFPRGVARERVTYLLEYWSRRFGVQAQWVGDRVFLTGRVFGMQIRARFEVTDKSVVAIAADPGLLWRNRAHSYVFRKLHKYLDPDYADP